MTPAAIATNPFPGLRPYDSAESDLFFGRDEQIDELLAQLGKGRFVAVVGTSGSGKSSLVRAGLVPALERGYLTGAGSQWRVATLRPGGDPIGELARNTAAALGIPEGDARAELARSSLGLAEFARRYLNPGENLLVVVDQFEELFRYHKEAAGREEREAAAAFVKLLLTATGRSEVPVPGLDRLPVFVVLTMRSDYLGRSSQFRGLPEALNGSQYLVPRMRRDQLREAIEGPVGMAGARITPQLVERLLNDTGDNPDQLPVLQHVLMRCWEVSLRARERGQPIDLPHYDDVGGMSRALNLDADQALATLSGGADTLVCSAETRLGASDPSGDSLKEDIVRRVFQRLVEPGAEEEESRRPSRLSDLVAVCATSQADVLAALQPFRDRGFLVFSSEEDSIIDISHESLIRLWGKLKEWVKAESDSASTYTRLADWVKAGYGPYSGVALDQALGWKETAKPNDAWAQRYRPGKDTFQKAIDFLDGSIEYREAAIQREAREAAAQREAQNRRKELRRTRLMAIVIGAAFVLTAVFAAYGYRQRANAETRLSEAEVQRLIAETEFREAQRQRGLADNARVDALKQQAEAVKQAASAASGRLATAALLNQQTQPDLAALLSIEGDQAADGFEARNILLLSLQASPSLISFLQHHGAVYSVAFSPDGKLLASASADRTVWLWDVARRQPLGDPLAGHVGAVRSVAFSPDGRLLASASDDRTVRLWDVARRQPLGDPLAAHTGPVTSVAFSPDGKLLASASDDKTVRLWDVARRQPLGDPLSGHTDYVTSVAFSPDGKLLATAGDDRTVRLWDVVSRQPLGDPLAAHTGPVTSVAFSPDGKLLAFASEDQTVRLWDVARRQPLGDPLRGHTDWVISVAFSPDGKLLASASDDKTVRLWDVARRQPLGDPLAGHVGAVRSVAFSPDGKLLASASADRTLRLWDVARRQPLGDPLAGHTNAVLSVAFSPDGKLLASASADETVRLWDVARRQPLGDLLAGHTGIVNSVAFSPDGKLLASASYDHTVRLWDVARRQPLGDPLAGHTGPVLSVAFSPDGRLLASASADRTVRLWDVARRQPLGDPLPGHTDPVYSVAFSPDGKLLASASSDQTRLSDVARRLPLGDPLAGHTAPVWSVAYSPDGKLLASASYDNTVRLWDLDPTSWATRLCRLANRNLSAFEWEQYMGAGIPYRRTCPDLPPGEGVKAGARQPRPTTVPR